MDTLTPRPMAAMRDRPVILLTGGSGQIGRELARVLTALGEVIAPPRAELDLLEPASIREAIRRVRPSVFVNAAACTAVDRAESEPASCAAVNAGAPDVIAGECRRRGALLVHLSTDYVFDGTKRTPYLEGDAPSPLSVYGRTKADGERAVASSGCAHLVVRTSWVYASHGRNFPRTMLRLARERDEIAVVNDQTGAPTSAAAVAGGIARMLATLLAAADPREAATAASGIYHMTAAGAATWYDVARVVLAADPRRAEQRCRALRPIATADHGAPARRPPYSVLDCSKLADHFGIRLAAWEDELVRIVGVARPE